MRKFIPFLTMVLICIGYLPVSSQVLNKDRILQQYKYWHNKDFDWYKRNIPFLETPDKDIDRTYYYRWDNLTLHLVYGSPQSGYACTEFIDRPWWSGKYGTISCAAGFQLSEFQWIRDDQYWKDFSRYWFQTPGAQPRNYSTWIADAIWNGYKVKYDKGFITSLKASLIKNYQSWEKEHWVEAEQLFAWDGMHDGMETNINSRQTPQWFEGAPGYRPTLNSYMWADANAIRNIALLDNDAPIANQYQQKADQIKNNFQEKCWDPKRDFFFHRFARDERDGIKANTLTYQTGKFAGNPHGREEIGFVPWYFNMPDSGFEAAWKFLMDTAYFYAPFGPTTVEKHDPLFNIARNCCAWSGNAWPFATSQTLKGMANLLKNYEQQHVTRKDYVQLLHNFANTHLRGGEPYIGEANHPETGSWSGHDHVGHSEHYFHSSYIDLVITGLMGFEASDKDSVGLNPLFPSTWDYACLDNIKYHGNDLTIIWDKTGKKYNKGKGLLIFSNGKKIGASATIKAMKLYLPAKQTAASVKLVNYAVNNEPRNFYPHINSSYPGIGASFLSKMNDGQYWYLTTTPNQWTNRLSGAKDVWVELDMGSSRPITQLALYFVSLPEDGIHLPASYTIQYDDNGQWKDLVARQDKSVIKANSANRFNFKQVNTQRFRIALKGTDTAAIAISEIEAWGPQEEAYKVAPNPTKANNLAHRSQAIFTRSYQSRFDDSTAINDGLLNPNRRWTAFESPQGEDWVSFQFKQEEQVSEVHLYVFNDNGGVKPPASYQVQYWDGTKWQPVADARQLPEKPIADLNICRFKPVRTNQVRIILVHQNKKSFSGLYEVEIH